MEPMEASELWTNGIINMPQEIVHEILCRVTIGDVARTSSVSKAFRSLCVSLRFLNFNRREFDHLGCAMFEDAITDIKRQRAIGRFFTRFPMITEIRLEECGGLRHLKLCGGLIHLKRLEISHCKMLESVEIMASKGLEKLVLCEIERARFDEFHLRLTIDSQTCEALRELTLCNSTLKGITFSNMFSNCSNVESLVLDYCVHFYKITIPSTHQKLRRLVIKKCINIIKTVIKAPNLTSFNFCNIIPPNYYSVVDRPILDLVQYCEQISSVQECMFDFNQMLYTQNIWISLWFDKFKDSGGQKMVIYPKCAKNHVIVLEDWSLMAELSLMIKICEASRRKIITTMSFLDLAYYVFGDTCKGLEKVLAISSTESSKLYEVLGRKAKISCKSFTSMIIAKQEMDAFSEESFCSDVNGFLYKALHEAGKTTTLKATSWCVSKREATRYNP